MYKYFFALTLSAVAGAGFGYTNSYSANFNTSLPAGWSDPFNANSVLVGGETTPADSPAYSPTPNTATGFNNNGWLRVGTTNTSNFGITLALWDGTGGGGLTEAADYTVEADVFIVVHPTIRHHQGIAGRATGTDNFPFELFYSNQTPGNPDGFGWRNGGSTNTYGAFPAETGNKWVHLKMTFHGAFVDVFVDKNKDSVYDYTSTNIPLTATTGKAGFFSVLNDPTAGNAPVTGQYAYFDSFTYTPTSGVSDWSIY
ncbi:MAG: hypothetical protein ACR2IE_06995 [Candidatus Sumerlaeaceae bacterium]